MVEPWSSTSIAEAGGFATFVIRLGSQPAADVFMNLSSVDETVAAVWPPTTVLSGTNWNQGQVVRVTAVPNNVDDVKDRNGESFKVRSVAPVPLGSADIDLWARQIAATQGVVASRHNI